MAFVFLFLFFLKIYLGIFLPLLDSGHQGGRQETMGETDEYDMQQGPLTLD